MRHCKVFKVKVNWMKHLLNYRSWSQMDGQQLLRWWELMFNRTTTSETNFHVRTTSYIKDFRLWCLVHYDQRLSPEYIRIIQGLKVPYGEQKILFTGQECEMISSNKWKCAKFVTVTESNNKRNLWCNILFLTDHGKGWVLIYLKSKIVIT